MLTPIDIGNALAAAREKGEPIAIISILPIASSDGRLTNPSENLRLLVGANGERIAGGLGSLEIEHKASQLALELIRNDRLDISAQEIDGRRVIIEVARPPERLIICGGGHVGRAVAGAARFLNLSVTVIDDRADFVSRERFPDENVQLIAADFVQALQGLHFTASTHVVIVTRGHKHDEICLKEVIERPARYIGMIGSRRRTTTIREHLRKEGVSVESLKRVHAPVGLDIGALTPEEIALAIMSEIVMVRRGGTGMPKGARMLYKAEPGAPQ